MTKEKQAKEILMQELESVYCDSCRHKDNEDCCDNCHRKSMMWGISEKEAEHLVTMIQKTLSS